jgi:hypothetical protein
MNNESSLARFVTGTKVLKDLKVLSTRYKLARAENLFNSVTKGKLVD